MQPKQSEEEEGGRATKINQPASDTEMVRLKSKKSVYKIKPDKC